MIQQTPAHIFKSHSREKIVSDTHRVHSTFNFNNKKSFGALSILNDENLAANEKIDRTLQPHTLVMILPLVGATECNFTGGIPQIVVPGEAFTYYAEKHESISIANPYEDSLINFLYIVFTQTEISEILLPHKFIISQANLSVRNELHKLFEAFESGLSAHIGIFDGRKEATYITGNATNGIFAFVISGAFEIEGRLLEERDGLALWDNKKTEAEALSDNAILLLIEAPIKGFAAV